MGVTPGPLRGRFAAARARIRQAYQILAREFAQRVEPTLAEEWLLDNSHVVEDQIREIQEDLPWGYLVQLPRLREGSMRGYPRVYGLCLDYLRHTDAKIELSSLSHYVLSYQSAHTLSIGELWAIPIMLRLGLVLTVGALAASEAGARDRARGDAWAARLVQEGQTPKAVETTLRALEKSDSLITSALLVQLLRRLREHDILLSAAMEWVARQCAKMKTTPEELTRKQHLRQAADQVSVGNAITSMRAIAALDWNAFFEATSAVEGVLRSDPMGVYAAMNNRTRDQYRHVIEGVAKRSRFSERDVATTAIALASAIHLADPADRRSHVGYWLVDHGRRELERKVGHRRSVQKYLLGLILGFPHLFYIGSLTAVTVGALVLAFDAGRSLLQTPLLLGLLALALLPASEMAFSVVNGLVVALVPPRLLPRMEFIKGIPKDCRTLVVVPTLIDSPSSIDALIEGLEIRSLANLDDNLGFALVTDFVDCETEHCEADDALVERTIAGVAALNAKYGGSDEHRYILFHRPRLYNASEHCWMGRERKRGKLEDLNLLLRNKGETTFSVVTAPRDVLDTFKYVITLDTDTELPRDTARRLVEAIAHPLNSPHLDADRRVTHGHAIIQPRVGNYPPSALRSRYARLVSGPLGIDPYTTAVSDVYQDLFDEGSFVGKGIYDIEAFSAALEGRVPDNRLLSHDLFEGIFARSALASDIEVLDGQPVSYEVAAGRAHRWVRGDWQLLPWLLSSKTNLRLLDAHKIIDNLRRSLLAPALVTLCFAGWLSHPTVALWVTSTLAAMAILPVVFRLVFGAARASASRSTLVGTLGGDLADNARQSLVNTVFLLDQALVVLDAIARTLYRLLISKQSLLEWKTTSQAEKQIEQGNSRPRRIWFGAAFAALSLVVIGIRSPLALPFAAPVALLWVAAPWLAAWLSQRPHTRDPNRELTTDDRLLMRTIAAKTWRFFETFVTEQDHFLPPDNYQEDPRGVLAHRTSPTNIGLYLLSIVAARDLRLITLGELVVRSDNTLTTIDKLEKREGHVLNWYDTKTLQPLEPQYVSTVDSGNLAAYLWTLREASNDLLDCSILDVDALLGVRDCLRIARDEGHPTRELEQSLTAVMQGMGGNLAADVAALSKLRAAMPSEREHWTKRAAASLDALIFEVRTLAPYVDLESTHVRVDQDEVERAWGQVEIAIARPRTITELSESAELESSARELDAAIARASLTVASRTAADAFSTELKERITRGKQACAKLRAQLDRLGERSAALADKMNFRFLYNEDRELFSIGYNASSARLDPSHYDLLASEARLASLVAIAKGDVPEQHWFRMGRPRALVSSERALLSWSGSMFEYLMPLLVTQRHEGTLLDETYASVVHRQRAYAAEHDVPWGISESAYNVMDLGLTYQYHAFGVPGLGLKTGLADDLVIAPYASALAALVEPKLAIDNLRVLAREGGEGEFGYYDAIDYTSSHLPPNKRSVVVKTFMAHHQGMTLVALSNVLGGMNMQKRFHREPRIRASELMLQERLPVRAAMVDVPGAKLQTMRAEPELDAVEHVRLVGAPPARAHLLGHGELSTLVTALGEGVTTWRRLDVNRFREDLSLEMGGIYVYVRDHAKKRLWSAGYQPTRVTPDRYDATFAIDRVEINRRDGDLETVLEVAVSPEDVAEVRKITLTNHSGSVRDVDVTTFTEVVLAARSADVAHRAFSGMFVETEVLPERRALLAKRRPRSDGEKETWLVQLLVPDTHSWGSLEFETSREDFIGRGRSTSDPVAMGTALSGTVGTVIDPCLALRMKISLEPGASVRLALTTALASSREEALALIDTHSTTDSVARTFELAWADARVELKHLGVSAVQSHRFQRLLSAVLFPDPSLRASSEKVPIGRGPSTLWTHGISGDLPIVMVCIDDPEFSDLLHEVLLAQEFWRLNGIDVDLVVLNEEPSGYLQPQQEGAHSAIHASPGDARLDQRGGVFLRRASDLSSADREVLSCAARVVLPASRGSLSRQLRRMSAARRLPADFVPTTKPVVPAVALQPRPELLYDNGIGGFAKDGSEYVMQLGPGVATPAPWCNVIANAMFGTVISESGACFSWYGNSQRYRLTPWSNDPTVDSSGELIYLRDDEDGSVWSPAPSPCGASAHFTVRHGQGYSVFEHVRGSLRCELEVFVDASHPVKVSRLRIENRGRRPRHLSAMGIVEWVLGDSREKTRLSVVTEWDASSSSVLASNPLAPFFSRRAFFSAAGTAVSYSGDRQEVLGAAASRQYPASLGRVSLSNRTGAGFDPCGALLAPLELAPGAVVEVAFLLGSAADATEARSIIQALTGAEKVDDALQRAKRVWTDAPGAVTIHTPDAGLDALVNHWLPYQVLSCRVWGRSACYQSGGAYGFRDQLQDVLALLNTHPQVAREHILRAAARQFAEGDVQHWWHPESGQGVRTRCSDDMLWLPYCTAEYVRVTGDATILDESVRFLDERPLKQEEEDLFGTPSTRSDGSLYEHCVRALTLPTAFGAHGLPTMRGGDWNDGMNRVGRQGRGESVWLAWFLSKTASDFLPIARAHQDEVNARFCEELSSKLGKAADENAWDGEWYRRAYFDDGSPMGSHSSDDCKLDAIAQSWATIAGNGDPSRAALALASSERMLVRKEDGLMRLLTPAFRDAGPDPGYIRAYPAGIRENGGQYTHGALWTVWALALAGERQGAWDLFSLLSPISHSSMRAAAERYRLEPYVATADVYDSPDHVGRGGWSWYTGSAGWMLRVALEQLIGISRTGSILRIAPRCPPTWDGFEVTFRHANGTLHIVVQNFARTQSKTAHVEIDGVRTDEIVLAPGHHVAHVIVLE